MIILFETPRWHRILEVTKRLRYDTKDKRRKVQFIRRIVWNVSSLKAWEEEMKGFGKCESFHLCFLYELMMTKRYLSVDHVSAYQGVDELAPIDQTLEKEHEEKTKVKNIQVNFVCPLKKKHKENHSGERLCRLNELGLPFANIAFLGAPNSAKLLSLPDHFNYLGFSLFG